MATVDDRDPGEKSSPALRFGARLSRVEIAQILDENPYVGLAAFQEGDADQFFGRGPETAAMVARLRDRPLIAVVGSAGAGKSSFVRAGVIPALKRSGELWEALVLRPGRRPIEALAAAIRPIVVTGTDRSDELEEHRKLVATLRLEPSYLGDALRLHARRDGRRVLVFVDQLEELYTQLPDPAERAVFTACLAGVAADPGGPLRVVLAIRSDFLDRAAEDRWLVRELAHGLFFLGPPSRDGLRDALVRPAEAAGFQFELPATVDDMIGHLEAAPGALPLIQFAAARLWDLRDKARRLLTHDSYAAIGGVAGALARHADQTVDTTPAPVRPLVREAFRYLVTSEGTHAAVERAELFQRLGGGGNADQVIERLIEARLLTSSENDRGAATIEVAHDALLRDWPRLVAWRREEAEGAHDHGQLHAAAQRWHDRGRPRDLLWRGDALAEHQLWRKRHAESLTPLEAAFGEASAAAAARVRRIRRVVGTVVILAALATALWRMRLAASQASQEADRLLGDAYLEQGRLRVLEGDKLGALAPLAAAYRTGETGEVTRLLLEEAARPTRARLLGLEGHTDKVWDVAYSPDGKWLATASADHTARIWDAETGALRATVRHADRVNKVAFSSDSRYLASAGQDHTVRVWDAIAGREVAALPIGTVTRQVEFSPDASLLLTASAQRVVKLWKIPGGAPAGELAGHDQVMGATFCADGSCIVTWDLAKVMVWDAVTLAQRVSYPRKGQIFAVAVSRTGSLIAIATASGELVLLRGDGGEIVTRVAHDDVIFDIAISPDETIVATGSNDRTVRLWSASGEPRGILAGHRANITRVRFTPAGDRIVTTSVDGTARLWSASGMLLGEMTGHTDLIMMAAVRPDGRQLATASWDHTAVVWDLARAQEYRPLLAARDGVPPTVAFDPDGDRLAIARTDGALSVVDVQTGAVGCAAPGATAIQSLAWTGSEQIAVVRSGGHAVELWDARRCTVETTLEHPGPITAMSLRSGRFATAADNVVRVWSGGSLETSFTGYTGSIQSVGVDGDDVYAITDEPATVVVDTVGAPGRRRVFHAGTKTIGDVRFDREHGRVIAGSWDQLLYIWDAETGALASKPGANGMLAGVRLNGSSVIGLGGISPAIWDRASGARIGQLVGHSDLVSDGEFLDDQLFVSLGGHTAIVWDVVATRPLMTFHNVRSLAFSEDRRSVALVGATGVRVWSPRAPDPDLDALRALHPK